ncbi:C40 family peptidase [Rhodanobacter sp. PCA2]|uniref:C40 family peptidase n=1 Tax=Rhodanobacter sp. PCA2 TaxID=2006117 RepID=UPI002103C7D7|nr:C40 family peptidase [Rhodanobacter sp. PCA2]
MLLLAPPAFATTHQTQKSHPAQKKHVQHRHAQTHHTVHHSRHGKSAHPQSRAVASTAADSHYSLVTGGTLASPLALNPLPALSPMPTLASPGLAGFGAAPVPAFGIRHSVLLAPAVATAAKPAADPIDSDVDTVTDLRRALVALAMNLRDVRYVRGGSSPSTGFDCSGFVRYVFAHAIGVQLPANSASQFLAGLKVKRADMKPGDLVFFHTGGRRHRVSHVGIYISNGRFIHAPTYGKSVQISSLEEAYWARHFVGAKRPDGMLALAHNG